MKFYVLAILVLSVMWTINADTVDCTSDSDCAAPCSNPPLGGPGYTPVCSQGKCLCTAQR